MEPDQNPSQNPLQNPDTISTQVPDVGSPRSRFSVSKKLVLVLLITIVVLVGLAVAAFTLGRHQKPYTSADIATVTTKAYSAHYVKKWTDLSANKKVLGSLQASVGDTGLSNQKVYAYKYDPKTNQAQTLLLTGSVSLGVTDEQFKQSLADPATKKVFESSLSSLTSAFGTNKKCAQVTSKTDNISYATPKFIVSVRAEATCQYSPADQKLLGIPAVHESIFFGIKGGNTYVAVILANQSDWLKNTAFYNNNIMNSVQPK